METARGLFGPNKVPEAETAALRPEHCHPLAWLMSSTISWNPRTLQMKYFQYLPLLLTELYLDWYFKIAKRCWMA